jgi:hypothetical protein
MALHLLKLCVGCDSVEDLEQWIAHRLAEKERAGEPREHFHVTRMVPKQVDDLIAGGGSLYWVIKGAVQCRQGLVDIRPFKDAEGVSRCRLVLDTKVIRTEWQPRRAFQGWRYLRVADAPADLGRDGAGGAMSPQLQRELSELGLL